LPTFRLSAGKSALTLRGDSSERLQPKTWAHVVFTYDGSRGQNGMKMFVNGKPYGKQTAAGDGAVLKGEIKNAAPLKIGGSAVADFRVYNRALRLDEARILASWSTIRSTANTANQD